MEHPVRGGSSTSNSIDPSKWKYDVFLSFAGKDTRLKFTDHLYEAFKRSGIKTFKDNVDLERGVNLKQDLSQAIQDSLCAVLVVSENYANSTWCLDELQMIIELGRRVFPIFYDVDPADVRYQRKSFGKALAKHEERFVEDKEKVQNWKNVLFNIANLVGWDTRDKPEADLIKEIVGDVWTYLSSKLPSYFDNLVGIEPRVADMMALLEIGLDDKHFVGIWGESGVGKTTLARVVFEKISHKFEVCCFLADVRRTLKREGLVSLQKRLLSHLKIKDMEIYDDYEGMKMIRRFLGNIKVLLVLDDINDKSQLKNLAQSPDWFEKGSRIIISTRDSQVLTSAGVDKKRIYEVKNMEEDESLVLFSNKAFNKDHPEETYLELSKSVVEYTRGLPLALDVLGSFLCKGSEPQWKDALDRLKQIPKNDILQKLQISYDGLNEEEKMIFLDIACFFKGWRKTEVSQILKNCGLNPTIGIKVLIEKAFLVETEDGKLEMHDLLEELGRYIVDQESPNVGEHSRLWKFEDIKKVLEDNKGSEAIQAIVIQDNDRKQDEIEVHPEAFSKMDNIRLLILNGENYSPLILSMGLKLSSALKVVRWPSFPFEALPLETPLDKLVHIEMCGSRMKQLWNGIQFMNKLKFINLSDSTLLIETSDFSGVLYLEHINLSHCTSLVKVHPSLGKLKALAEVHLRGCRRLEILPRKLETNSLIKLDLSFCEKVAVLPEFGEGMERFSYLNVSYTAINRLPKSLGSLTGLRYLNLGVCKILNLDKMLKTHITRQISGLNVSLLTELDLSCCGLSDSSIPDEFDSFSSLIALDLSCNDFVNLPTGCFSRLFRLLFLSLDCCARLKSLPRLPPRLIQLNASRCDSMEPLTDKHLWNWVASLDHKGRGRTKYVISNDEWYNVRLTLDYTEACLQPERLPLGDFSANIPGSKIPSWFPNTEYYHWGEKKLVMRVKIPPNLCDSEWFGIVACLQVSSLNGSISWSSKAPEDDDYVWKEWAHFTALGLNGIRHLCIMVLELNEKTCWQHLRGNNNSLDIQLSISDDTSDEYHQTISRVWGRGWRMICKEEIQEWCHLNHFNQITHPQWLIRNLYLENPLCTSEVELPWRVVRKFFIRDV